MMQRSLRWIGIGLLSTTLSSCGVLRSQLGLNSEQPDKAPPVVSDSPRAAPLQPGDNVIVKAVDRVGPAVVRIDVVKEINNPLGRMFGLGPATQRQQGQGSGFITRSNGLIFTNEHVVRGADKVAVTLPDGRSFTGKVLGGEVICRARKATTFGNASIALSGTSITESDARQADAVGAQ